MAGIKKSIQRSHGGAREHFYQFLSIFDGFRRFFYTHQPPSTLILHFLNSSIDWGYNTTEIEQGNPRQKKNQFFFVMDFESVEWHFWIIRNIYPHETHQYVYQNDQREKLYNQDQKKFSKKFPKIFRKISKISIFFQKHH